MAYKKQVIRLTTIDLNEQTEHNEELQEKLWNRKNELDGLAKQTKEARLKAEASVAEYQILAAQRAQALARFFLAAGEANDTIAMEEGCMPPYINGKGHICVDIPFTQREKRLAVRAAHHQLTEQAKNGDDDEIDNDLYETGETR